jgi:hypothetical protein
MKRCFWVIRIHNFLYGSRSGIRVCILPSTSQKIKINLEFYSFLTVAASRGVAAAVGTAGYGTAAWATHGGCGRSCWRSIPRLPGLSRLFRLRRGSGRSLSSPSTGLPLPAGRLSPRELPRLEAMEGRRGERPRPGVGFPQTPSEENGERIRENGERIRENGERIRENGEPALNVHTCTMVHYYICTVHDVILSCLMST